MSREFKRVVESYHERGNFDGAVLAIHSGKVVFSRGWRPADCTWGAPNDTETKFHTCSITKPFTAVLLLRLVGADKLGLDDVVTEYLPWYRADTGRNPTRRTRQSQTFNTGHGWFGYSAAMTYASSET